MVAACTQKVTSQSCAAPCAGKKRPSSTTGDRRVSREQRDAELISAVHSGRETTVPLSQIRWAGAWLWGRASLLRARDPCSAFSGWLPACSRCSRSLRSHQAVLPWCFMPCCGPEQHRCPGPAVLNLTPMAPFRGAQGLTYMLASGFLSLHCL